jgi:hypothetical protein
MGTPKHSGELGDTVFDGVTTWLCLGGTEWVMKLPAESDALIRQRNLRDIEADDRSSQRLRATTALARTRRRLQRSPVPGTTPPQTVQA